MINSGSFVRRCFCFLEFALLFSTMNVYCWVSPKFLWHLILCLFSPPLLGELSREDKAGESMVRDVPSQLIRLSSQSGTPMSFLRQRNCFPPHRQACTQTFLFWERVWWLILLASNQIFSSWFHIFLVYTAVCESFFVVVVERAEMKWWYQCERRVESFSAALQHGSLIPVWC